MVEIKKTGISKFHGQDGATERLPTNIRDELVLFEELGRGASGVVRKALHVPSLQLVAVKVCVREGWLAVRLCMHAWWSHQSVCCCTQQHVRIYDKAKRHQMISELKTLYAYMVPLEKKKQHKTSAQAAAAAAAARRLPVALVVKSDQVR